jgi:hypothetical protein
MLLLVFLMFEGIALQGKGLCKIWIWMNGYPADLIWERFMMSFVCWVIVFKLVMILEDIFVIGFSKIFFYPMQLAENFQSFRSLMCTLKRNDQKSIFVHVPPFHVIPKEIQVQFVKDLIQTLLKNSSL